MPESRRKPWIAGILSLLTPGLGHLYSGQPKRAITLYLLVLLSFVAFTLIAMFPVLPATFNIVASLLLLLSGIAVTVTVADAIRLARKQREYQLKAYNKWYFYLAIMVIAGFVFHGIDWIQTYKIPVNSMMPTLIVGDRIYVNKLMYHFRNPGRGDVIVFDFPEDETKAFIKRVIGLPGETLEIRDKAVWIDGQLLKEGYVVHVDAAILPHSVQPRDNLGPLHVPQDAYFLLGDNRDQSLDSRFFGSVNRAKITGKASTIYWSFDRGVHWERIGMAIR